MNCTGLKLRNVTGSTGLCFLQLTDIGAFFRLLRDNLYSTPLFGLFKMNLQNAK